MKRGHVSEKAQGMRVKKSLGIALCGLLGAMMIVIMMLGSIVPFAAVLCPAMAGFLLLPIIRECGENYAFLLYLGIALLSLLLVPDKEVALLFALLLGPYPILAPRLSHIPFRPLRIAAKLLICNLLIALIYALLLLVLAPGALVAEFSLYGKGMLILLLLMANVVFLLYDISLARVSFLYECKLRDKLFRKSR